MLSLRTVITGNTSSCSSISWRFCLPKGFQWPTQSTWPSSSRLFFLPGRNSTHQEPWHLRCTICCIYLHGQPGAYFEAHLKFVMCTLYLSNVLFNAMCRYGPLVNYWCMRYEAKHSLFKKLSSIIGNYINLPLTLAKRHQHLQCYRMICPAKFLQKDLQLGKGMDALLQSYVYHTRRIIYVHLYIYCIISRHR